MRKRKFLSLTTGMGEECKDALALAGEADAGPPSAAVRGNGQLVFLSRLWRNRLSLNRLNA